MFISSLLGYEFWRLIPDYNTINKKGNSVKPVSLPFCLSPSITVKSIHVNLYQKKTNDRIHWQLLTAFLTEKSHESPGNGLQVKKIYSFEFIIKKSCLKVGKLDQSPRNRLFNRLKPYNGHRFKKKMQGY